MKFNGKGMSSEAWGLAFLIAFEVPNLFSGLLPSLFTISTFSGGDSEKREHAYKWIRKGEIQAGVVSLGLGIGGSMVTKSWVPMFMTALMISWLVTQYETALHKGADGPSIDMDKQDDSTGEINTSVSSGLPGYPVKRHG